MHVKWHKQGLVYLMWYSRRHIIGFRSRRESMYRAGFARSRDGIAWIRDDELAGIEPSGTGWDGDAIAYPCAINVNDSLMLFYHGNDFGRSGFGYAIGKIA